MFKIAKNKPEGICVAFACKNKQKTKDRFCAKHRHRYRKENDILRYTFYNLQTNAKRRGKEFKLTLVEFEQFCIDTGYLKKKGRTPSAASIDRIDSSKGYEIENIQILSYSKNSAKGNRDDLPF